MKTPKELSEAIFEVIKSFPPATIVWHKASGRRGVIVRYNINIIGAVTLEVDFDQANSGYEMVLPPVLSFDRVLSDGDEEEWKKGDTDTK